MPVAPPRTSSGGIRTGYGGSKPSRSISSSALPAVPPQKMPKPKISAKPSLPLGFKFVGPLSSPTEEKSQGAHGGRVNLAAGAADCPLVQPTLMEDDTFYQNGGQTVLWMMLPVVVVLYSTYVG